MNSSSLSGKQISEINSAILEYFLSTQENVLPKTIAALREEAKLDDVSNSGKNLLEKKWTSVVRLQKKVMDLEAKLASSNSGGVGEVGSESGSAENKHLPKAPPRYTLSGHREAITCVSLHPVYSLCATGSEDATIRIWDFELGQFERVLKGHTGPVTGLAFEPSNGKYLASCSLDMTAKLWDTSASGGYACFKTLRGHDHSLSSVLFTLNGDNVITCSRDQSIRVWEVNTGYCVKTLMNQHTDWVRCLSLSLDGECLASGSSDHTVVIWKVSTGQMINVLRGHEHVVETVAFGKKSAFALVQEGVFDKVGTNEEGGMQDTAQAYAYLVSGSRDKTVRLWDTNKGECIQVFAFHDNWVRGVCFHPSMKYIISCSDDKSIKVVDIKDGRCVRTLGSGHDHFVTCIAVPPLAVNSTGAISCKYHVLISGSVDKNIIVWPCN